MRLTAEEIAYAQAAARLCLFAHYDEGGAIGDHVIHHLDALRSAGFAVLVASTATLDAEQAATLRSHCDGVELRPNVGLDFGSWKHLVGRVDLARAEQLLLCNDSVYGPLVPLDPYLEALTARDADFYGVCGSIQHDFHLQSWFLLFAPRAFRSRAFADFFDDRTVPTSKRGIIVENEVRLTRVLVDAGLRYACAYDPRTAGIISRYVPFNATHLLWRQLIETGQMPFIKVDLMRDNPLAIVDLDHRRRSASVSQGMNAIIDKNLSERARRADREDLAPPNLSWLGRFGVLDPVVRPELRHFMIRDFEAVRAGRRVTALANGGVFLGLRIVYLAFARIVLLSRRLRGRPPARS